MTASSPTRRCGASASTRSSTASGCGRNGARKREIVEEAQRLHLPAATVASPEELLDDPQLIARGFLQPVDHPDFGRINFPVGALASLYGRGISAAPHLGANTARASARVSVSETPT